MGSSRGSVMKLSQTDNIAIILQKVEPGVYALGDTELEITAELGMGHKIASQDIGQGQQILKYGFPIGVASRAISKGEHVHLHNMESCYTKTHSLSETSGAGDES